MQVLRQVPLFALLLAPGTQAGAHPFAARDVVGGEDISTGWTCRVQGGPPGPCEVAIPAGRRRVRVSIERVVAGAPGQGLSLGHFATATRVAIDGRSAGRFGPGLVVLETPALAPGGSVVAIETWVSSYRRRPAWDGSARIGPIGQRTTGLLEASVHPGTRRPYLVQVPDHLDEHRPSPLVVALHPWGVGPWAYVGSVLLRRAAASGIVVLMPDGLGNSLWVGDAEREALAAIDALASQISIDPDRVYLFGASMGGAGATTIGYRHPDRFAAVASFFGDSLYSVGGYTSAVLPTEESVRAASCLLFVENARHLPTLLVHGRLDATSSPLQSTRLGDRLGALGFAHDLVMRDDRGHEARLVDEETERMLAFFALHRRVTRPSRVSLRSSDASTRSAYWLRLEPSREGWVWADVEIDASGSAVRVLGSENVRRILIDGSRAPLGSVGPTTVPPSVTILP
ncbi:MAG: prolyl oligopeptidase family serine peptidase [Deltaproteobacteria bacterium]|nr:prolyl oligopeptidase family serine peptidase [Deltaproteobacteria bacterium]